MKLIINIKFRKQTFVRVEKNEVNLTFIKTDIWSWLFVSLFFQCFFTQILFVKSHNI